jgi:hypothetical protein
MRRGVLRPAANPGRCRDYPGRPGWCGATRRRRGQGTVRAARPLLRTRVEDDHRRAAAGDAIWFKATIDRIADILAQQGDDNPVEMRRSKAIGILAQPAEALRLLCQHQHDDSDGSAGLDDPDQQPAVDDLNRDHPAAGEDAKATAEPDDTSEAACDEDLPPASDPTSSQEARHRSLQIIGNLGPHIRYHHRIKTFGGWQVCQPEPGTWLWRSPHHRIYLVNPSGTHPLGNTEFAQTIWRATADPPAAVMSEPS